MIAQIHPMTVREVVICMRCCGRGKTEQKELIDPHKNEYSFREEDCEWCQGTGRLMKTLHTTFAPFIP